LDGTGTQDVGACSLGGSGATNKKGKRQAASGDACPAYLNGDGGGQSIGFTQPPTDVPASPTCPVEAGCGGTLCTGCYCNPEPTGDLPGFLDPKDPNASNPVTGSSATKTVSTPPTTTTTGPISTSTFPPAMEPDIIFCYTDLENCENTPCTVASADYYWFIDDGVSTCEDLQTEGLNMNVADPSIPGDLAIENSKFHFPVFNQVPLGTKFSAQNCMFLPVVNDGTGPTADNFYGPLQENHDLGTWWCSSGQEYDDTIAVQMGNCYKRFTDSGLLPAQSNSEIWTLYYCRSEMAKFQ
jgi:hypothetical protein